MLTPVVNSCFDLSHLSIFRDDKKTTAALISLLLMNFGIQNFCVAKFSIELVRKTFFLRIEAQATNRSASYTKSQPLCVSGLLLYKSS
jgi:hypothetical protein